MFLAYLLVIMGLLMLLQAMGVVVGNLWGLFWAILFLFAGFKLLAKKNKCPMCGWKYWGAKIHDNMHYKMDESGECCGGEGHCCGDENCCEEEKDGEKK